MPHLALYFDGASKNNPHGPAGCGWALYETDAYGNDQERIARGAKRLGRSVSNNQAEYRGLIEGMRYIATNIYCGKSVYIRGDSEVVIKQMLGKYHVRSHNILSFHTQAQELEHIVRDSTLVGRKT
jgi:ribonuclease HI